MHPRQRSSGPKKHFATILSLIQPSCMCCGFFFISLTLGPIKKPNRDLNTFPSVLAENCTPVSKHFATILSVTQHTMGQLKPHRYLNTLPSVLAENCTPCLFRPKNILPLFSQLYSLLAFVVFLRHTMAQIKPHCYLNTLPSVLVENCTLCLFRTWKTLCHHSLTLYKLLACVVVFRTYHGPIQKPHHDQNTFPSVLAENCTPCLLRSWKTFYHHSVRLYSLRACVVFLRHTMGQLKAHRYLNTLQSVLAEYCTPCLFRTWKTLCHHSL